MNMESTPLDHTKVNLIFSWKESMFITTKPLEEDMFPELFWLILNLEPWTLSELVLSETFSDLTTSFSDNQEPETIGPKAITLKVLN